MAPKNKPKPPPKRKEYEIKGPERPEIKDLTDINMALALAPDDMSLQRVFVKHVRLIPFSHRHVCSLRHPRVAECVALDKEPKSYVERFAMDRFAKIRTSNKPYMKDMLDKWTPIGVMFDTIAHKEEVAERRNDRLKSRRFNEAVERWWGKAAKKGKTVVELDTYTSMHERLYVEIFEATHEDHLETAEPIAADFKHDSRGAGGVSFPFFKLSLFELTDNWAPTMFNCVDCHAEFLNHFYPKVWEYRKRRQPPPPKVPTWEEKREHILAGYQKRQTICDAPWVYPVPVQREDGTIEFEKATIPPYQRPEGAPKTTKRGSTDNSSAVVQ
uniref:Uncharacterized protein n=1 Tax=Eutreptiella gymnastica TaxID=73025 RepID=A0A7S1NN57_9EUGL|mmetsp:Transcript_61169/g.109127  ORF Transcript_61169/g.109127 Transcript_61169/m.109127 type:complete len:328 (+) Transcript_61169:161-1144(+)